MSRRQFVVNKARGEVIDIRFQVRKNGPRQVVFQYDLTAAKDVPVTMVIAGLGPEKGFARGQWTLSHPDGTTSVLKLPVGIAARPAATKAVLGMQDVGDVAFEFQPPCPIAFDGDMRVLLADTALQGRQDKHDDHGDFSRRSEPAGAAGRPGKTFAARWPGRIGSR